MTCDIAKTRTRSQQLQGVRGAIVSVLTALGSVFGVATVPWRLGVVRVGAVAAVQGLLVVGPAVIGAVLVRAGGLRRIPGAGLIVGPLVLLLLPALPGHPGAWIIAGTAVRGCALAVAGAAAGWAAVSR